MATQKLTKAQSNKLSKFETYSAKIRYLHSLGWSNGDISRKLTTKTKLVRYQWVRNVLQTKVKTPKES